MHNGRPIYSERTWAPPWIGVLLWGACLLGAASMMHGAYQQEVLGEPFGDRPAPTWVLTSASALILLLSLAMTCLFARLDVDVWPDRLEIAFAPARLLRKTIPFSEVQAVDAVTYRPIREFGGWGVRFRPRRTSWTIRGNRAVRVRLNSGREVFVGSLLPNRLAERIRASMQRMSTGEAGENEGDPVEER